MLFDVFQFCEFRIEILVSSTFSNLFLWVFWRGVRIAEVTEHLVSLFERRDVSPGVCSIDDEVILSKTGIVYSI